MKKVLIGLTLLGSISATASETFRNPKANIDGNSMKINCESDIDKVCSLLGKSVGENYTESVDLKCEELASSTLEDAAGTIFYGGVALVDYGIRRTTGNGIVGQSVRDPWKQKNLVTINDIPKIVKYYAGYDKVQYIKKIKCK